MRIERKVEIWGTVVILEANSITKNTKSIESAFDLVESFLVDVDNIFSTYKEDSEVTLLRKGLLGIEECSEIVKEVWSLCIKARELTNGSFDPWSSKGGYDPSGLVKGWAAQIAVELLKEAGIEHCLVNASGDIVVSGGSEVRNNETIPWNIGVVDPEEVSKIVKIFDLSEGCIATSGTYRKGPHIVDPYTGMIAIGALSATVIGPEGALADALATALIVDGDNAVKWLSKPELFDYSFWVINRHDRTAWQYGANKGYSEKNENVPVV
jgi:thiamine biosynthesis lipoprotein